MFGLYRVAQTLWKARRASGLRGDAAVPAKVRATDDVVNSWHRTHESSTSIPLWCALVTRVVKLRSKDAPCETAQTAIRQELDKMNAGKVWDDKDVHSLSDLLKAPKIKEASADVHSRTWDQR